MFEAFYLVVLALLGAVFGSFANVVVWRFPRGESLSHPPSHCPRCGHAVRWYDNIPVVSWLVLRGRCRDCGQPIPVRYPLVEATSAILWVVAGLRFGSSAAALWAICLFYLLLILSFIDLDTRRLPNPLVGILAAIGLAGVAVSWVTGVTACPLVGLGLPGVLGSPVLGALAGAVLGAGLALLIAVAYEALRGRAGMGMGDVKLLGALGLFLGPFVVLAFFAACVLGATVGLAGLLIAGQHESPLESTVGEVGDPSEGPDPAPPDDRDVAEAERGPADDRDLSTPAPAAVPFGPFLALGTIATVLWGQQLVAAYLRFTGIGGF